MRRSSLLSQQQDDTEVNLTPMLDVVFILLIFFIVTTSFVRESGIEVDAPQASTAEVQAQASILIAITPDGDIWVDRQPVSLAALGPAVARLQAAQPQSGVVIQADKASRSGRLVEVMDRLRQAGVDRIALAAQP
ncbi:ExbD/TolR family protein [Marinospirillum alkaliphilum]|uniref:Outer membrane transport energization protein ExbD (TC 2.C.1.1.1) n=1 Tax=Marinospirillum alkaliphilum DSM 21637 TaxID=1122209 RepID=A0A1K1UYI1_9GAMM|nr:biopolymer transporter ExbD [Marinospirillum alkaliphilum]SFX17879.1 outer membrane transport energization protein ExbD (TC 2.C.1.1.1) [Marinospirillum alkaliphilum DSM 21637]